MTEADLQRGNQLLESKKQIEKKQIQIKQLENYFKLRAKGKISFFFNSNDIRLDDNLPWQAEEKVQDLFIKFVRDINKWLNTHKELLDKEIKKI